MTPLERFAAIGIESTTRLRSVVSLPSRRGPPRSRSHDANRVSVVPAYETTSTHRRKDVDVTTDTVALVASTETDLTEQAVQEFPLLPDVAMLDEKLSRGIVDVTKTCRSQEHTTVPSRHAHRHVLDLRHLSHHRHLSTTHPD